MEEIKLTPQMYDHANSKAQKMGELNRSITKGTGNLAGFLGEIAVQTYLENAIEENTYDYDLIYNNIKIDVKTKRTSVVPRPEYESSVVAYNIRQKTDVYVFTRIFGDTCYIMGYMPKEEYYKKARYLKKGTRDGDNWFTVKENCYNMFYKDLYRIEQLKELSLNELLMTNQLV